jgi:putative FmdB family regulatory protein
MPIYSYSCPKCGFIRDELRKMGDTQAPQCVYCKNQVMNREFTPVATVLKGSGWNNGDWSKLRRRSVDQGKKFFKRHPDLQTLSEKSVAEKPTS